MLPNTPNCNFSPMNPELRSRVFVTRQLPTVGMEKIAAACDAKVWGDKLPPPRNELLRAVQGCHGLVTLLSDRIDAEVFEAAGPELRIISNYAVGVNNIDLAEAKRRGIAIGNTPDVLTDATADIAVALLLAAARHLTAASEEVREGGWTTWEPTGWLGRDLVGRTVGIVGMGRIGTAVARRLFGGWDMKVLYTARTDKQIPGLPDCRRVGLDELLINSDFISLHTDLNDETRELIGRRELSLMKPTAVLINTARGGVLNQDALVAALASKQIFAAGLDVTEPEPLDYRHPLVSLPNCIILPHIASATADTRNAMAEICADNLIAGLQGQPLRSAVV